MATILTLSMSCGAAALLLCACHAEKSHEAPSVMSSQTAIQKIAAGDSLLVTMRILDNRLLKATKVEVTLDDAVKKLLEDAFITSVKTECQLSWEDKNASFEVPTTTDFRPGIWHISFLKFWDSVSKKWLVLEEGVDFDGVPLQLTNTTKFVTDKPKLDLLQLKVVPGEK